MQSYQGAQVKGQKKNIMVDVPQKDPFFTLFDEATEWAAENNKRRVELLLVLDGITKDPSLLQFCADELFSRVLNNDPLSPKDRLLIACILIGVRGSTDVASGLFGQTYRGAPRKGAKGLSIAKDVVKAVQSGAPSLEAAWEDVSNNRQVSFESVKKYWIEWKLEAVTLLEAAGGRRRSIAAQVKSHRKPK